MLKFFVFLQNFLAEPLRRDTGATAVEYGMIVALIAVAIVAVVTLVSVPSSLVCSPASQTQHLSACSEAERRQIMHGRLRGRSRRGQRRAPDA